MFFIRKVLDHPEGNQMKLILGHEVLPHSVIRVLVSISDQLDDKLRNLAGMYNNPTSFHFFKLISLY
jgi:hypothetical protein